MENRITRYFDERPEMVEVRIEEVRRNIAAAVEKKSAARLKDFQNAFTAAFQQSVEMQRAEEKSAIAYVCVTILRSSLITKTYRLRIDLYGGKLYSDRAECTSEWDVGFAFQWIDDDMVYFTKCARKKLIRIQDAEMMIFMQHYQEHYFSILEDYCACKMR